MICKITRVLSGLTKIEKGRTDGPAFSAAQATIAPTTTGTPQRHWPICRGEAMLTIITEFNRRSRNTEHLGSAVKSWSGRRPSLRTFGQYVKVKYVSRVT